LDPTTSAGEVSSELDYVFNSVFLLEATMKIIAYGWFLDENSYLTESWS
jgi:Ion transport protein